MKRLFIHTGAGGAYFFPMSGESPAGCAVAPTSPVRPVPRTKLSVAERSSTRASSMDAATWADFDTAQAAVEDGKADGVGFVLGDG